MIPARLSSSRFPSIVNVFPEPVWPYAKMHTLKPPSTDSSTGSTSSKTSAWPLCVPKTWSNVKARRPSRPPCVTTTSVSEGTCTHAAPSVADAGRTRHMTRIEPLSSWRDPNAENGMMDQLDGSLM